MSPVLQSIFDIMRLRQGPQDLPFSWVQTLALVAGYLAMGIFTGEKLGEDNSAATGLALFALQVVAVTTLLTIRKVPERLAQTLMALAGTGIVFAFLSFLFLAQADPEKNQPVLVLAWFSVFFWSLLVEAHIYSNAMRITRSQGVLVAVLLMAGSYVMIEFATK